MNDFPPDFGAALKAAGLTEFFAGCTAAHQREYLNWIGSAKKPETRAGRIAKAVTMIAARRDEERRKARR